MDCPVPPNSSCCWFSLLLFLLFSSLLSYTLGLALRKNLLSSAGGKPHYTQGTLLPPWPGAWPAAACWSVFLPRQSGEAQTLLAARRSGFGAPPWSQSSLSSRELRVLWHSPQGPPQSSHSWATLKFGDSPRLQSSCRCSWGSLQPWFPSGGLVHPTT